MNDDFDTTFTSFMPKNPETSNTGHLTSEKKTKPGTLNFIKPTRFSVNAAACARQLPLQSSLPFLVP